MISCHTCNVANRMSVVLEEIIDNLKNNFVLFNIKKNSNLQDARLALWSAVNTNFAVAGRHNFFDNLMYSSNIKT